MPLRTLGHSDLHVSPVAMGCWPIAGVTTLDVRDEESLRTLRRAVDCGIRHFDTAYCYGYCGESETLLRRALAPPQPGVSIATKCGIHWNAQRERIQDGRPATLRRQCEESRRRLGVDALDLLYLHAPDPAIPLEVSAGELRRLQQSGAARWIGLSNATLDQIQTFHAACPLAAVQLRYNLLQRDIEQDIVPWCRAHGVGVVAYWPLMKGLLAGKLLRNHPLPENDPRRKYPLFREPTWSSIQDFVDTLRDLAPPRGRSVAALAVRWAIDRPGITVALCGAKRGEQIAESAEAMSAPLDDEADRRIEAAYQRWLAAPREPT